MLCGQIFKELNLRTVLQNKNLDLVKYKVLIYHLLKMGTTLRSLTQTILWRALTCRIFHNREL